jgi:glutamine cyclotransferase
MYESTGGRGNSTLRKTVLETGAEIARISLPAPYFAEGIVLLGDSLFLVTWQEQTGFIYEPDSLRQVGTFAFRGQGWGLTTDGASLILSDGTNVLKFLDPTTFQEIRRVNVLDGDHPVNSLNELEWIDGQIWANVWPEDEIVRIDPESGRVLGWIDVAGIVPPVRLRNGEAVPNGIALDPVTGRIYMTGKLWPETFEVRVEPVSPAGSGGG